MITIGLFSTTTSSSAPSTATETASSSSALASFSFSPSSTVPSSECFVEAPKPSPLTQGLAQRESKPMTQMLFCLFEDQETISHEEVQSWSSYIEDEIGHYEPAKNLADDFLQYQKTWLQFHANSKFYRKDSQFSKELKEVREDIAELKGCLQHFGTVAAALDKKLAKCSSLKVRAEITLKVGPMLKEVSQNLKDQVVKMQLEGKLVKATKTLRHRNQKVDGRKNQKEDLQTRYYIAKNASSTWDEKISQLDEHQPTCFGTILTVQKAEAVKKALEEKETFLSLEELGFVTNSSDMELENIKKLVVENLPVVCLKKKNFPAQFLDARQILGNPAKIVEMWEAQPQFQVI